MVETFRNSVAGWWRPSPAGDQFEVQRPAVPHGGSNVNEDGLLNSHDDVESGLSAVIVSRDHTRVNRCHNEVDFSLVKGNEQPTGLPYFAPIRRGARVLVRVVARPGRCDYRLLPDDRAELRELLMGPVQPGDPSPGVEKTATRFRMTAYRS